MTDLKSTERLICILSDFMNSFPVDCRHQLLMLWHLKIDIPTLLETTLKLTIQPDMSFHKWSREQITEYLDMLVEVGYFTNPVELYFDETDGTACFEFVWQQGPNNPSLKIELLFLARYQLKNHVFLKAWNREVCKVKHLLQKKIYLYKFKYPKRLIHLDELVTCNRKRKLNKRIKLQ